jgi:hypothetical protein
MTTETDFSAELARVEVKTLSGSGRVRQVWSGPGWVTELTFFLSSGWTVRPS